MQLFIPQSVGIHFIKENEIISMHEFHMNSFIYKQKIVVWSKQFKQMEKINEFVIHEYAYL